MLRVTVICGEVQACGKSSGQGLRSLQKLKARFSVMSKVRALYIFLILLIIMLWIHKTQKVFGRLLQLPSQHKKTSFSFDQFMREFNVLKYLLVLFCFFSNRIGSHLDLNVRLTSRSLLLILLLFSLGFSIGCFHNLANDPFAQKRIHHNPKYDHYQLWIHGKKSSFCR